MTTTTLPNGNAHVSIKWLAGILVTVILALLAYFVGEKDRVLTLHGQGIDANAARINVLYERVTRLETKLDSANDKLDSLLRAQRSYQRRD